MYRLTVITVMVISFVKESPFKGVWNGYLLISEEEEYYGTVKKAYAKALQDDEDDWGLSVYDCTPHVGDEEATLAEFLTTSEASKWINGIELNTPLDDNPHWLLIGFDSLHSWDTPETQSYDAVLKRVREWKEEFINNEWIKK